jgi:polyketide biosynthesis enoyl-CoA hydratase PksH
LDPAVPYQTLQVDFRDPVCHIQLARPDDGNTINDLLVMELQAVLSLCEPRSSVVVLAGSAQTFCMGADFRDLAQRYRTQGSATATTSGPALDPSALYSLWLRLASGPFITVAHVEGKANAGGVGFVAASDIVLAGEQAQFSLSELLFGLYPACVMPFLVRRVGLQRAHYLTLTAQSIPARQAADWGLVDAVDAHGDRLLQRHLQRLTRLKKSDIQAYKAYMRQLTPQLLAMQAPAVAANEEMFANPRTLQAITAYVERGVFPWEAD